MRPVNQNISFSNLEKDVLRFWKENNIFQRSMDPYLPCTSKEKACATRRRSYVFYDGPPFATGLPHYGHLLAGTIKDVIGRFFTMKGLHVDRRFGWDCHGVPVEFEIQKKLDLHGAKAVRHFGVDKFNEECRKIVLRYTAEWEEFVERSGRWVDFTRQYRTMDLDYMESIWWVMRRLWDLGLIYEGVKCVPYSWAMNTPLSNFEANLNYQNVQDPAVTVRVRLKQMPAVDLEQRVDYPCFAYIWTTTPWTLPSNMALAVKSDLKYALVLNEKEREIAVLAYDLAERVFPGLAGSEGKKQASRPNGEDAEIGPGVRIIGWVNGQQLTGLEYEPMFPYFAAERERNAFRIYSADFVTADEGTGIVHCASFGEEDLGLFLAQGISIVDPVDEDGKFTEAVPDFSGKHVKEADPLIIRMLRDKGSLVSLETIEHSYPFCWRTDTPLIYKSISSWFVRVEKLRDELMRENSGIHWVPGHIREGRFGKWLEGVRDWAISRNRFWGAPIPIWRCENCAHTICLGSVEELAKLGGEKVTDLHSHYIDHIKLKCEKCSHDMRRIPQVFDCWFESGAMPYAQAHYPFEGKDEFEKNFPADFIAEGLDQTRGWFYTLLVLSVALFKRRAFQNVIVNGIVLAEDGKKMSKSLQNYPPPDEVMDELGADAMRLYLLSSAATRAEEFRFSKSGVRQVVRQTLLPLWNAYNFFVTYALVDNWAPPKKYEQSPNLLDRWILSKVASLIEGVDRALSSYHLYAAAPPMLEFVDQLTNWYIRLNRRRFWSGDRPGESGDKMHAYATLHRALVSFVRVLAPLAPFISEEIFQNLREGVDELEYDSVHLAPFPSVAELEGLEIDSSLERSMEYFEEVILLGRALRNEHNLKVRQPLSKITVIHADQQVLDGIRALDGYICDELNVKEVHYSTNEEEFVTLCAKLNTKTLGKVLGPKLGREGMQELREKIEKLDTRQIRAIEQGGRLECCGIKLGKDDLVITRTTKAGSEASASSGHITIVLDTTLSAELRLEGFAREFINRVQKLRKDFGFEVTDRIVIKFMTACPKLTLALADYQRYVMEETLAVEMTEVKNENDMFGQGSSVNLPSAQEIEGNTVIISLARIQS